MKSLKIISATLVLTLITMQGIADEYVVKSGDSVRKILIKQGFKGDDRAIYAEVVKVINLNTSVFKDGNPDRIFPGNKLILPSYKVETVTVPVPAPEAEPEVVLPPSIGQMEVEKGSASIVRNEEPHVVNTYSELYSGDKIVTAANSQTRLEMNDGALFELGPNTEFFIDEYEWPTEKSGLIDKAGFAITTLFKGVVRAVTGKIGQRDKNNFRLKTSAASIGIRGTDYTIRYCEGDNCGGLAGASVAVIDGGVSLNNEGGKVDLNKGEFARAESANSVPFTAPMPEGFLDLALDVSEIAVTESSWWEELLDVFN